MITSKQNIVFFDVDNTLFDGYTQQYFVRFLKHKKKLDAIHTLVGAAWFAFYKLRIIKTEAWGINMLLSRLKGMSREQYDALFDQFFADIVLPKLYPAAMAQIKKHKQDGARVLLLSTSLDPIIRRIAQHVGADQYVATKVGFIDDRCVGKIDGRAVSGIHKYQWAKKYLSENEGFENVHVYADHFTDYPLLKIAHVGYVINPNFIEKIIARLNQLRVLNFG